MVLKIDKRHGGMYFITNLYDYHIGMPSSGMNYPDYYTEMIDTLSYSRDISDDGTWLLIGKNKPLKESEVEKLVLDKTKEHICDLLEKCSLPFIYAHFEED